MNEDASSDKRNAAQSCPPEAPEESIEEHIEDLPEIIDKPFRADVRKQVMSMAWPCIVELMLMSLLGMADTMMVGRLGYNAINAITITDQPVMISFVLFQAFNVGGTAIAARAIGAGDMLSARKTTAQVMLCNIVFGIFVSILLFIFARPMLLLMGAQPNYLENGVMYMRYAAVGVVFSSVPSAVTALLRAVGNTRTPMQYNLLSNVVNIVLNFFLIFGIGPFPEMGVEGAAVATLVSKIVVCAISLFVITDANMPLRIRVKDLLHLDLPLLKRIAAVGLPAAGEQVAMRIGLLVFTRIVTSTGDIQYAAHSIAMKIQGLTFNLSQAFGITATSFTGRFLGGKRPNAADFYIRTTRRMGLVISLSVATILFFSGGLIARAFTKEPEVIQWVARLMRIVAFIVPAQTSNLIIGGSLRGAGDTMYPLIATVLGLLIMRAGMSVVFVNVFHWGLYGAWAAFFLDQYTRSLVVILRFNTGRWKKVTV